MSGFFNMDNVVWRTLGRLADLMILNILFIICCIPIFTIGASLTALNYVTLKMHDGEEGYAARSFFKAFRQNFKQATPMWLIELVVGFVLVLDLIILQSFEGTLYRVMTVIILILCMVYLMIFCYLFAVQSRFENTIRHTFTNAFIMAIADFPRTLAMLAIAVIAVIVSFYNVTTITWSLLVWIMVGFALISYINTGFLSKIFKKYMPEEEAEGDPDHWDIDEIMGTAKEAMTEITTAGEATAETTNVPEIEDNK
ncbi:MAG: YesL family protein [Clostridiales bacterium]|nr:YesL family protein [Clostridiales bacterium]